MKKGFVHIREYDLTKMILDKLDIDIEEDFQLVHDISPLYYKDNPFILPEYSKYKDYYKSGTVIRPFVNTSHAQYLINMFSDIKSRDVLFQYEDNDNGGLKGTFFITGEDDYKKDVSFYGLKNIAVLMSTLLLKTLTGHETLKSNLKDVFKLDKKLDS